MLVGLSLIHSTLENKISFSMLNVGFLAFMLRSANSGLKSYYKTHFVNTITLAFELHIHSTIFIFDFSLSY